MQRIYDGVCGSCGLLCEAFDHFNQPNLSMSRANALQKLFRQG